MKRLVLILCLMLPVPLGAQTTEDTDRGFLEGLLEDNLSGAGRDVQIEGFRGALSSTATIDSLTIADTDGVWLTLTDVTLNWNRAALLSGRLDVTELSAKQLRMPRKPVPVQSLPSAEATPLQIPELPVAVRIAKVSIPQVVLGPAILGQAAVLDVAGSASLSDGSASVDLAVRRTGTKAGKIILQASYAKETQGLSVDLSLEEPQGGLAASLLGIQGAPPLALSITGKGPVSGFNSQISLSSDGQPRFAGQITLGADPQDNSITRFAADLGGDLTPLLSPEYRAFFGTETTLKLAGDRHADGALTLKRFDAETRALSATGQASIAPNGWPSLVNVEVTLASQSSDPILLPLTGPRTYVQGGQIALTYNAARGDAWNLKANLDALQRPDLTVRRALIIGNGTLVDREITGVLDSALVGVAPGDAALARAIGPDINANLEFDWSKGAPISLTDLQVESAHLQASGAARVSRFSGTADLDVWMDIQAIAHDLTPLSDLVGRQIDGAADVRITGSILPVSGGFDLRINGTTQDLAISEPRLDPFLHRKSNLGLSAKRDGTGAQLTTLLVNDAVRLESQLSLMDRRDTGFAKLVVTDLAPGLPELPGPLTALVNYDRTGKISDISAQLTLPGQNQIDVSATVNATNLQSARIDGEVSIDATDIGRFATLTGHAVQGQAKAALQGWFDTSDESFQVSSKVTGTGLQTGIEQLDALMRGETNLSVEGSRDGQGILKLRNGTLQSDQGRVQIASVGPDSLSIDARLNDLAILLPELSGAASLSGTAALEGPNWHLNLDGQGPGGSKLRATGWVAGDGTDTDLTLAGAAPLALANGFIRPMNLSGMAQYDLDLNGPPSLSAASGKISTRDARLALPDQRFAMEQIAGDISLARGSARVSMTTQAVSGGTISANGQIGLSGNLPADLSVQLSQVVLTDPTLYETTISGPLAVTGGLMGNGRLTGQLQLGPTELRVPNPSGAEQADLPGLRHKNIPADVQRTRVHAGLVQTTNTSGGSGGAFALDLQVLAPDRIFVRGRGLDAELGGALSLKGDTNNVLPEGRFDLIRGRLDILGKRLSLTEGLIQLQGAFDPFIRFAASTDAGDTTATIVIEGQASAPKLSFMSSPSLPEDEVLALILFGKEISSISPFQAVRLAAAIRTLTGGGEGIGGKVRQELALDDLDITTSETGATEARAGKYISENIYSEVTADTEGNSQINLNLNINRSITARGRLGSDGETGIGLFIEKDY